MWPLYVDSWDYSMKTLGHRPEQDVSNTFYQMNGSPRYNRILVTATLQEKFWSYWITNNRPCQAMGDLYGPYGCKLTDE